MAGYVGNIPVPQGTQTRQTFTATASQTSFPTLGYTAGFIDVYLNGVKLLDTVDYAATNGSDVVLTTGAALNDILEVTIFDTFTTAGTSFTNPTFIDTATVSGDTTATVTLKNNTEEDTDGGRESTIIFQGEQSGGEISTLAEIEASHDGTADDEKGDLIFRTNDGSDGASPTERLRISSEGNIGINSSDPDTLLRLDATTSGTITSGNNRSGPVIKLHHEGQWESSYGNNALATSNDFLGGIEFSTGDTSTGEGVRAAIRGTVDSYFNTNSLVFETAPDATASAPVEHMRINPAGIVTKPNQPSFSASVSDNNATYSAGTIIPFTTQLWDTGNNYNNASGQCIFTAPVAGVYSFFIHVSSYGARYHITLYKNGSSHITIQCDALPSTTGWQHESNSGLVNLAENDTIQLKFSSVTTGGSGMVDGGSTQYERFSMYLVG